VPKQAEVHLPVDLRASRTRRAGVRALSEAIRFPSDPTGTILEANEVAVLFRSDVRAHIEGNRKLVAKRMEKLTQALSGAELTPFEVVPRLYGDALSGGNAHWLLSKTLAYLDHLEVLGRARRIPGEPERWTAVAGAEG